VPQQIHELLSPDDFTPPLDQGEPSRDHIVTWVPVYHGRPSDRKLIGYWGSCSMGEVRIIMQYILRDAQNCIGHLHLQVANVSISKALAVELGWLKVTYEVQINFIACSLLISQSVKFYRPGNLNACTQKVMSSYMHHFLNSAILARESLNTTSLDQLQNALTRYHTYWKDFQIWCPHWVALSPHNIHSSFLHSLEQFGAP